MHTDELAALIRYLIRRGRMGEVNRILLAYQFGNELTMLIGEENHKHA